LGALLVQVGSLLLQFVPFQLTYQKWSVSSMLFQVSPREIIYESSGQYIFYFVIFMYIGTNICIHLSGLSRESRKSMLKYASAG
jgi:hypothetical protein